MAASQILQPLTAARLETHLGQKKRLVELMGDELAENFVWIDPGLAEETLPLYDVEGYWSGGSPKEEGKSLYRLMQKRSVPLDKMLDLIRASPKDKAMLAEWAEVNPRMKALVDRALRHRVSVEREFMDCVRGLTRMATLHPSGEGK